MVNNIIHRISNKIKKEYGRRCYLCNEAVRPKSILKYSFKWKNVTCKNCLKQKPKEAEIKQGDKE